ncbi:hypothetical protein FGD67_21380 [Colwellia sp. M166]|uniref:hypothetical protein n=1 Tax=Colwellia sp. M166 TaxID=2583805 RepID=UPI00211DE83A|nr:hypothetical protein [Colwellia sp. M166]UUO25484.1 hypothetical protein FGD67_21380 [Colwellia sp. M166]
MKKTKNSKKDIELINETYISMLMKTCLRISEVNTVKHIEMANIKLSSNSFRHFHAMNYFRQNLESALGHTSIKMTSKYIKYNNGN